MAENGPSGPLAGVVVLDLATPRAEMAGRVLADLGAEVIKVEPPGGAEARLLPPFEAIGARASLFWAALGRGKRSVVLDLGLEADRSRLRNLARVADVLIESFDPGTLDGLELGYEDLSLLNPRLVYVSVTPYGGDGPKSRWPAADLTLEAASGRLALQGDRDRPPLPIGYPQASLHAGTQAAADAIIALNEREVSGLGQRLDTSMQEAMVWTLMDATGYPPNTGADPPGSGDDRGAPVRGRAGQGPLLECADGYVLGMLPPASLGNVMLAGASGALTERGLMPEDLREVDWSAWAQGVRDGALSPDLQASAAEAARRFLRLRTKRELMDWACRHDLRLAPVNTTRDLLDDAQLRARGFWREAGGRLHPGPFARLSRTPLIAGHPAPAMGGDEARLEDWLASRASPVRGHASPAAAGSRLGEAFAGLKVADFSWVAAGPISAKALADHGATVVKVESARRPDVLRNLPPFKDNSPGLNRSQWLANCNSSKLSVALDLSTDGGRHLARRLADWADVIVESFTPGTMKRFGLDYETLSSGRPDLVMLSTCLLGQTGPWASFAGYGNHGAALAGVYSVTGWPDRPPCGPAGPYSDVTTPRFAVTVLAAALLERRRSGLGQHIDLSQVEACIAMIEPLLLDQAINGRTAGPAGMDSPTACPHGVYPAAGSERYVAIAVETAAQWRGLLAVAPLAAFADRRFDALEARREAREAIDAALASWTAGKERRDIEAALTAAGVPASVVQRPSELYEDPQLGHRAFFVTLDHPEMGPTPYDGLATRFSAKKRTLHKAAPLLGEDTDRVLRDFLGLREEEIEAYRRRGALA